MSKRWLKKLGISMLSFTLLVSLIATAIPGVVSAATEAVEIGIEVQKAYDVDVVLAVDNSTQNIDTYKEDLQRALESRGINASNLNIQSVQVNETNILEGTFKLNLKWDKPPTGAIDMDSHVEFWNETEIVDELFYDNDEVYGSTLDNDDMVGGVGEIIALSLSTVPVEIKELKVLINAYNGEALTTMYLFKTLNGLDQELFSHSSFVRSQDEEKFYFGSFKRFEDSWDFHAYNGSIFKGKEVEVISKDFMEVLREPDWRASARKYIVNLNDSTVPDFENSIALGEIVTRMDNDQIHYIGWGEDTDGAGTTDLTQNQAESFISKNNDNGTFVNRSGSTYQQQVEAMADYIADNSRNEANNEYLELGQNYDLIVTPSSELTNTKDENWPNGKWKIEHDPSIYENNTGVVPYSGQYLDDFLPTFDKVGQYDIYYSDQLVKTLYVHRQPVSRFDVEVNGSNEVTLTNLSYDLDKQSVNNGIEAERWQWKLTTDENWTTGQPSSFIANQDYIIQLMVQDYQGTWSTARSRYQSTQSGAGKPISDFELSANRLVWPKSTIEIENTSYDPRSATITEQQWTVYKGSEVIYTGNTPKLDFAANGVGTYKISLRSKNQSGTWSETFSRFLQILPNSAPTMPSIANQTMTEGTTKEISFQVDDENTGAYSVTVTGTSSNQTIVPNGNIVVTGNGKDRVVSVTPALRQSGTVTITLLATDGDASVTQTFTLTIDEKGTPEVSEIADQSINIGDSSEEIEFTVGDDIFAAHQITVTATSSNQELIPNASIVLGGTDENRTITFTPVAGAFGTADITIEATDPSGKKTTRIIKVTVSDLSPPNVTKVEVVNPDERYKAGDTIVIKVTFDEDVTVDGTPELALNFGSEPTRPARYTGGSTTNELIFEYTLQDGDDTEEIRISAEEGLQLSGGSIKDGNDNDANLTWEDDFVWDTLIVDTIPPSRPSIDSQFVKPGTSVEITSGAPSEGETAWLAPIGTTSFQEGTTITKLTGNGTEDTIQAPQAEGTYYLYVIDANGNVSQASENTVTVDQTPPNVAIIALPIAHDNAINKQEADDVIVSGTAEPLAQVEVTFIDEDLEEVVVTTFVDENGHWSIDSTDITSLADGTITVSVKVIDEAGNESMEMTSIIYKDTISPIEQDHVLADNQVVKGSTVISLNASAEAGDKVFVALPGATLQDLVENGTTVTSVRGNYSEIIAPSADGIYHVYIVDAAGNLSEPSIATILVDSTSPTIHSLVADETEWINGPVNIFIDASDENGSGIAEVKYAYGLQIANYFITNGIQVNNDVFEVDQNGIYTVYVRDVAGNERIQIIQISNIDMVKPTAPIITVQPDRDFYNQVYTVSITPGLDLLSGVDYTEYRITGAVNQDWTQYEEQLEFTEEGTYTLETRTFDRVGNVSETTTRIIVINRELTVFPTVSISPDKPYSNEDVTVTISKAFDESHQDEGDNSAVYYKIPSLGVDEYTEYTGAFDITEEGETVIEIMVRDRAGNESTITKVVNIDKTAPTNQGEIIEEDVIAQGNTIITILPSQDSEDTIWLAPEGTVSFEEGETMTKTRGDATNIVTPKLDGEYKIYVVDKYGNVSLASDQKVIVDNVPPTATGVEDGEVYKEYPSISFDEGVATLNGKPFDSGTKLEANGEYTFVLTDAAGNSTVIKFTVDNDKESVDKDTAALHVNYIPGDHSEWISGDITLIDEGFYGSDIKWTSSHEDILSIDGKVTPPTVDTEVTLTATITKGDYTLVKTFTVKVIADPVKPVIVLNGSNNVIVEQGNIYVEQGVQAIDNIDGNITSKVTMSGYVDTKTIGVYTLVYTVSDNAGNVAQVERTITVLKRTIPASTIIQADGDQKSTDDKIKEALKEANKQKTSQITVVVDGEVDHGTPVQVSIGKDQLQTAYNQQTKIELRTDNASITVPIRDLDMTQFTGNSRLELVIEQVDVAQPENQTLVTAIENMNASFAIYNNKVFDFKMRIIEEDAQGNVIDTRDIENFQTTEDIVLTISIGTNINEQLKFMTFYFNETSEEWEYIRSSYDQQSGNVTLLTNHLSIYSVMSATKAQKQAELVNILNKENITIKEVRSIIEDPDMDFDQEAMDKYDAFTDVHKDAVAEDIITKKPNGGYDYPTLSAQVTSSVNSKTEAIATDTVKPDIELIGPSTVYVSRGKAYIEQGVTATDDQDGNITGRVILIGSVDTTQNGTYILRYLITDVNGNQSEVTRTVIVRNASSADEEVIEQEPVLPVVIVDSQKDRYIIKENKDNTIVTKKEPQMNIVGDVYTIEAVSDAPIGQIVVQIKYDPSMISNLNQLAVYKYDEIEQRWISVGGIIDPLNHTVTITLDSPATIALMENKKAFNDLDGHWAKDIVEFLAARQIITGDSEGNFNPNMGITRAEFSTLIVRMLNLPINESASQFTDVTDQWYEAYITTAQQSGIVKGVSDTSFEPERVVSRQEMAAIIIRTLKKYKDVTLTEEDLKQIAQFTDTDDISAWAFDDVYAARKLELMIGRDGNKFAPQSPTLRGEAASVIYNLLKELELI